MARVVYEALSEDEFNFAVPPPHRRRRLYAPDEEIRGTARIRDGRVVVTSLTIHRRDGLSAATLRSVPLAEIRDQIEQDLRDYRTLSQEARAGGSLPTAEPLEDSETTRQREELARLLRGLRRRSPKLGDGDDFYRDVARTYIALLRRHPRGPVRVLTRELRRGTLHADVSENTVTSWVRVARERGWLTPARHGQAGAGEGPRLIEWKRDQEGAVEP